MRKLLGYPHDPAPIRLPLEHHGFMHPSMSADTPPPRSGLGQLSQIGPESIRPGQFVPETIRPGTNSSPVKFVPRQIRPDTNWSPNFLNSLQIIFFMISNKKFRITNKDLCVNNISR